MTRVEKKDDAQASEQKPSTLKKISLAEVEKHNSQESKWLVIHGLVYDVTKFLDDHPGGPDSLLKAGPEATEDFEDVFHSDNARRILDKYRIGRLDTFEGPEDLHLLNSPSASGAAANGGSMLYAVPLIILVIAILYNFVL